MRLVVGLSGGVDSSVAAGLLARAGHEVVGVYLRNGVPAPTVVGSHPRCCGASEAGDARRVAAALGIPFYALDEAAGFDRLIGRFADAYAAGETPNPCVTCNREVKLAALLRVADGIGAAAVATGHYARTVPAPDGSVRLRRAADATKDQTYFLAGCTAAQLARLRFPLGEFRKDEVRETARALGLPVADKPESQEICFVAGRSYREVVAARRPDAFRPGEIVDREGRVVGRHEGLPAFTVGQGRGLGLGGGIPQRVVALDATANRVVVGPAEALDRTTLHAADVRWWGGSPDAPARVGVQVRHRHAPIAGTVTPRAGGRAWIGLDVPVRGAAPGQTAAFYDGDVLVGAGTLVAEGSVRDEAPPAVAASPTARAVGADSGR